MNLTPGFASATGFRFFRYPCITPARFLSYDPELAELEDPSNGARALIQSGRLHDAERLCQELKRKFPDQHDWMEQTADLYAKRGEVRQAVEHYKLCIDFVDRHADGFDEDTKEWYQAKIDRLS